MVFLPLHTSVLEPDLDLCVSQRQCVSDVHASVACQVLVIVELLLQLQHLVTCVRCSVALAHAPHTHTSYTYTRTYTHTAYTRTPHTHLLHIAYTCTYVHTVYTRTPLTTHTHVHVYTLLTHAPHTHTPSTHTHVHVYTRTPHTPPTHTHGNTHAAYTRTPHTCLLYKWAHTHITQLNQNCVGLLDMFPDSVHHIDAISAFVLFRTIHAQ